MPDAAPVPVVPSRKDPPAGVDIYSRSRANEIQGKNPGFRYEYASVLPDHPQYVGNKLKRHEIGDASVGYCMCDPWEVVPEADVAQGKKRADDTKGIDTAVTHGNLVLIRTTADNHARYEEIKRRKAEQKPKEGIRSKYASLRVGLHTGFGEDGAAEASIDDVQNGRI